MIELRRKLRPPLGQFVDCLWYSHGTERLHARERLLPTGRVDITIKLQENRAVVSGAYSHPYVIDTSQSSPTLGIHFRPGGAAPLLGIPPGKLTNQHVALSELWGNAASALRAQLMEVSMVHSMFDLLENTLINRLVELDNSYVAIVNAVTLFTRPHPPSVQAMVESTGYPSKRFIRLFHEAVGLTPKLFCRIQRFQAVLDQIVGREKLDWVNVALDNGYYDQSHLIRDFRAFASVTPAEYRPIDASRKNHVVADG